MMNYDDTLVEVAEDCPTMEAQVPLSRGDKKTKALVEYKILVNLNSKIRWTQPYTTRTPPSSKISAWRCHPPKIVWLPTTGLSRPLASY
jgi:hypothetical protein